MSFFVPLALGLGKFFFGVLLDYFSEKLVTCIAAQIEPGSINSRLKKRLHLGRINHTSLDIQLPIWANTKSSSATEEMKEFRAAEMISETGWHAEGFQEKAFSINTVRFFFIFLWRLKLHHKISTMIRKTCVFNSQELISLFLFDFYTSILMHYHPVVETCILKICFGV